MLTALNKHDSKCPAELRASPESVMPRLHTGGLNVIQLHVLKRAILCLQPLWCCSHPISLRHYMAGYACLHPHLGYCASQMPHACDTPTCCHPKRSATHFTCVPGPHLQQPISMPNNNLSPEAYILLPTPGLFNGQPKNCAPHPKEMPWQCQALAVLYSAMQSLCLRT